MNTADYKALEAQVQELQGHVDRLFKVIGRMVEAQNLTLEAVRHLNEKVYSLQDLPPEMGR